MDAKGDDVLNLEAALFSRSVRAMFLPEPATMMGLSVVCGRENTGKGERGEKRKKKCLVVFTFHNFRNKKKQQKKKTTVPLAAGTISSRNF